MKVKINGTETELKIDDNAKFTDLIELVKMSIDPEEIITEILINGEEVPEEKWQMNAAQLCDDQLEVTTGSPSEYVSEKLASAASVLRTCYSAFRSARKDFQAGKMEPANRSLVEAVKTLNTFFGWYGTMIELVPEADREKYNIHTQVVEISDICKKICQHQLYQSWWALGETLENELEPKIDELEDFCRAFE